ncbi:MAG: glycerol-3-phosphate acyltransferase [Candidatus Limnocylindrales bacterium]
MGRLATTMGSLAARRLVRYGALAAVAYAIGTIQVPRLVQRRYSAEPVTDHFDLEWGEGKHIRFNAAGSTTVEVTTSPWLGFTTALLDMSKAVVPVVILRRACPGEPLAAIWATASTIGQMLPPQHRFRGGRGEAMLTGTAIALEPPSVFVSVAISQVVGIYVLRNPLLAAHSWTGILTLYWLVRRKPDLAAWTLAVNGVRWALSVPEARAISRYHAAGEFETREFHEAFESNHIGYIHKWLRERGLIHYAYMDEEPGAASGP